MDFDFNKVVADLQSGKMTKAEATKLFDKYASEQVNKTYMDEVKKEFAGQVPTSKHLARGLLLYWMDKYGKSSLSSKQFSELEKVAIKIIENANSDATWFLL